VPALLAADVTFDWLMLSRDPAGRWSPIEDVLHFIARQREFAGQLDCAEALLPLVGDFSFENGRLIEPHQEAAARAAFDLCSEFQAPLFWALIPELFDDRSGGTPASP
jgi:hypothetical protein